MIASIKEVVEYGNPHYDGMHDNCTSEPRGNRTLFIYYCF
jgi:hypothetical protein